MRRFPTGRKPPLPATGDANGFNTPLGLTNYSLRLKSKIKGCAVPNRLKPRFLACAALCALVALGGCKSVGMDDITGSIGAPTAPASSSPEDLRAFSDRLRTLYEAHPTDKKIAMAYARSLRARELNDQAAAVLQNVAIRNSNDREVLAAYGKALADAGRLQEAQNTLENADSPDNPNWSVISTRGSIADQLGDHQAAQNFYATALKISPDEPSVLSNLGLSYALSHDLPRAEQVLREAAASPRADMRVRQNLALVLALQGKFAEAEQISARDLSPQQARDNVASIRQMISQSNAWRDIQAPTARNKTQRASLDGAN
jgi:Flp pilus assembly protein TadD